MKLKKFAYRCMAVVCAATAVACVDDNYRLDELNTEVSVFGEKTVLPLGTFEQKRLGDLMKDVELPEVIEKHEDGSYEVKYKIDTTISAGEFSLQSSFEIPGAESSFRLDVPALSLEGLAFDFTIEEISIPALDIINDAIDNIDPTGTLFSGNEVTIKETYFDYGFPTEIDVDSGDEPVEIAIAPVTFDLPEQISEVCTVVLAKENDSDHGAPVGLNIDLNGLKGINAGGVMEFTLTPKGNIELELYNNVGALITMNEMGSYVITQNIKENEESVEFVFYIRQIDIIPQDVAPAAAGSMELDLSMTCDYKFHLDFKAGNLVLTDASGNAAEPSFDMSANIGLEDALVKFNTEVDLFDFSFDNNGFNFDIDGLPEQLVSINRIDLKDTKLTLFASGLEWLEENGDAVKIDMTLPEELVLNKVEGMTYDYDAENHMLSMSIADMSKEEGLILDFEAIDFGDGLAPENGAIAIKFAPAVRVHFDNGNPISVMDFFPDESTIDMVIGLKEASIGLESVSAQLALNENIKSEFKTGLADVRESLGGLEVGGAGLSPVIKLSLSNPLSIAANIDASLVPMVDGVEQKGTIEFKAQISAATYDEVTGVTTPGVTTIVLAKPNREGDFSDCVFVGCDIDELISVLPTDFIFNASFGLPNEVMTLRMIDELVMDVSVDLSLPIAFDDKLSISYEDTLPIVDEAGKSPLEELVAIEGIKVGDIALIAEIETNLPLEFAISSILLDKDGNQLPTKVGFADENNKIQGSKNGKDAEKSTLRLVFDLAAEDGSLDELKDIHSVMLKAAAKSVAEGVVSLNDDQYIGATLKLEIDGGITVDIDKFTK